MPVFLSSSPIPQPMQNARRIRANIDASADFTKRVCLFINMRVKSGTKQARRRSEPADATAYYRD
jgi:hypothetical protein